MLAKQNPYIESAYKKLQIISQDKEKRLEYEAREKAIRDYNQSMYEAEQRGIETGIKNMAKIYQKFGQSYQAAIEAVQEEYPKVEESFIKTLSHLLLLVKDIFIIFHHFFLVCPVFHALSRGE